MSENPAPALNSKLKKKVSTIPRENSDTDWIIATLCLNVSNFSFVTHDRFGGWLFAIMGWVMLLIWLRKKVA